VVSESGEWALCDNTASHGLQIRGGVLLIRLLTIVMAALVAAIHFPEAVQERMRLWKMDGRDKPGHDGFGLRRK